MNPSTFAPPTGHPAPVLAYLLALSLALWVMNQARRSFWLISLLALPGTFCHELCHWIMGKVLNAEPVRFTVVPRREGRGYILGAVSFANLRWYNAFFVGLAPLLLLPLAYGLFILRLQAQPSFSWPEAAMVFFLANLVFGALPSGQDLRIAARSPIGWLLLAAGLAWGGIRYRRASVFPQSWKLTRTEISRPAPGIGGFPPVPGIP